ncbi:MAG: alternative ribosome rescue aminoacyl-tRNA hydrolase ArfB [Nocardioides sp.]
MNTVSNRASPGGELYLRPGPGVPDGLVLPAAALIERFSRSSGPGGQSVNTTDSRVELEFDIERSTVLTPTQRSRVLTALAGRVSDGRIVVAASEHRSQLRNRVAARERLADLLREALTPPPPPRRARGPSAAARRRRLEDKRHRSQTKSLRRRVTDS